jgi:hypothetical protein
MANRCAQGWRQEGGDPNYRHWHWQDQRPLQLGKHLLYELSSLMSGEHPTPPRVLCEGQDVHEAAQPIEPSGPQGRPRPILCQSHAVDVEL